MAEGSSQRARVLVVGEDSFRKLSVPSPPTADQLGAVTAAYAVRDQEAVVTAAGEKIRDTRRKLDEAADGAETVDELRAELSTMLQSAWAGRTVVDLGELLDSETALIEDGIHLNAAAEEAMATAIWSAIDWP